MHSKTNCNIIIYCLLLVAIVINCYPLDKKPSNDKDKEEKNEKHFPNGTVVGEYSYADSEGNPIYVKYFADDGSYGVELKSVKVLNENSSIPNTITSNASYNMLKSPESTLESLPDKVNALNPNNANRYKIEGPFQGVGKYNRYNKKNVEYDIFIPTEINAPKKCSNDKVHIYQDKKNKERMIRRALDNYDVMKICEKF